jgi:hypothetical protein
MGRFQPGRTALSSADGIEAEAGLAVVRWRILLPLWVVLWQNAVHIGSDSSG